jgi:N,N-dimethylformamidase
MSRRGVIRPVCVAIAAMTAGPAYGQFHGFYTDQPSYEPGDTVRIHASAPQVIPVIFRLVRHGADWTEVARLPEVAVGPQATRIGSFVEVAPGTDVLGGRRAFTLEGWFFPTMVGGDDVVIAGQAGATRASAALAVLSNGRPAGYVSRTANVNSRKLLTGPSELTLDQWHHLALTYDAAAGFAALYVDGEIAARASRRGPVASNPQPFRIGARAEAPGDLTGIADGRFDSWALWPRALSHPEVRARRAEGSIRADPAPDPSAVDLYLGFEDGYGPVTDRSHHGYDVAVVNHGTPSVAGVHPEGLALRLHHDQLVDAGWPAVATIAIPDDAPSGLYSVQALIGPQFADRRQNALTRAVAVRPGDARPGVRVAVVLPTDTWTAYNDWPGDWQHKGAIPGITSRRRSPARSELRHGGNNSAYGLMGDGVSPGWFQGWQRPNEGASVVGNGPGGHGHKGPQSLFLVEWLERIGVGYDVYADRDLATGQLALDGAYRVLMPHGHHEYWSQEGLEAVQEFQRRGGSIVSIAGNVLTYRVSHAPGGIMEVRKWPAFRPLGRADARNAIDGDRAGVWTAISICRGDVLAHLVTGSVNHLVGGCEQDCYGRWEVMNAGHWLWGGAVNDGDHVGVSPLPGIFTIGHEADTYLPGLPPPGLAPDTTPTVLAEGVRFGNPHAMHILFAYPGEPPSPPSCAEVEAGAGTGSPRPAPNEHTRAGSIVYFRHSGGGHVLSVGAVSAPWSLRSDASLAGLLERGLKCFALGEGCPAGLDGSGRSR